MTKCLILACLFLPLLGLVTGCSEHDVSKTQEVTFDQLLAGPGQFAGKSISIEGFYFQGFEVVVLSEKLEQSGYAPGHLAPKGTMIWIEGGIPGEVYDRLYQQQMMGPLERYGRVRVVGRFEYGGEYGHLGAYISQIAPSEVELLLWSPSARQ